MLRSLRLLAYGLCAFALAALVATDASAQKRFADITGPLTVGQVKSGGAVSVPFITWGGDAATFRANGGLGTKSGSTYDKLGLKLKLTPGDDFVQQVKDYVSGKSPYLRGTFRMLGQASEVIGKDPRTKPVVILQLSWSGGDHIVAREGFKTLNDLKREGKKAKIACQQGGPHVGLLYDALAAAQLTNNDVEIVFVPDLTGPNGAAEKFRNDPSIDACCVITPDMLGLTGGLDSRGTGAEGTVKGAGVLVSTQNMSRSIADVYAVRSDYFQANRAEVEKFVAGYLKATEEVLKLRNDFEESQRMGSDYRRLLQMCQDIFGEEVVPTLEVDTHGLLLDCRFVGLPGQIAFFEQSGNLNGFNPKLTAALDLATKWGYAKTRSGFDPAGFDYQKIARMAGVQYTKPETIVQAEGTMQFLDDDLDEGTIVSFTISFEPNQTDFSVDRYGSEFDRALQSASTFGGAAVIVRGHSDPTRTLVQLIRSGMKKGIIKRTGQRGSYRYYVKSGGGQRELDLTQMEEMVRLIKSGAFEGAADSPMQTMQAALNLSQSRAEAVKRAIIDYARRQGITVNLNQLQPLGAGISDPVISKPKKPSRGEAKHAGRVPHRESESGRTERFRLRFLTPRRKRSGQKSSPSPRRETDMLRWTTIAVAATALGLAAEAHAGGGLKVVVILDNSGSMQNNMPGGGNRINAAKQALLTVLNQTPADAEVGVLLLNGRRGQDWLIPLGPVDKASIQSAVGGIRASGGTPLGASMKVAADALLEAREKNRYGDYKLLVVSDGEANDPGLVEMYLPQILSRGLLVDVIGVDMAAQHSLATRSNTYRNAADPRSLEQAISAVVLGESAADNAAGGDAEESDFEVLAALPDEIAVASLAALTAGENTPLGEQGPGVGDGANWQGQGGGGGGQRGGRTVTRSLILGAIVIFFLIVRAAGSGK